MRLFSTCRDCGEAMLVTSIDDTVHPTCAPKPTAVDIQCAEFLAAVQAGDNARANELAATIDAAERPTLRGSALYYSQALGWPVFPLKAGSKEPATLKGFKDATTNRRRIEAWWNGNPNYNIGLATGHAFDVVDIDPGPGGRESLARLEQAGSLPDVHGYVVTAGNRAEGRPAGIHLYVKATGRGNRAGFLPGIDYRGVSGYVVAPPSVRGERQTWQWLMPPSPVIKAGRMSGAGAA
ncbi:hypothetical protein MA4S0726RA_3203 [Mycobacteroides abscessus 4S-0726-RA]|nr:bifunctional DNA primase/polymerase [Mycobacteroides abscessus]EIT89471.1 hypothetical protein MA4S0303_3269 [Mycobacteroides abscessus 4S-0303]EIT95013.1 hypothetical protein MA4S0726RA_3203 [Mycobacteroides abscessus 4S-0726-RA]